MPLGIAHSFIEQVFVKFLDIGVQFLYVQFLYTSVGGNCNRLHLQAVAVSDSG